MRWTCLMWLVIAGALVCTGSLQAATLYDQGFEANTAGWNDYGGTVTRVASGTGGITSGSGGYHAVLDIVNGDGAYTFGNPPANPSHGNQFYFAPGFGTVSQFDFRHF